MAEQKVELRKNRDLSENLNDTFSFIRQNLRPLVTVFFAVAGIIMLADGILSGIYEKHVGTVFKNALGRGYPMSAFSFFGPGYYALIILSWINFAAMNVLIACYMKLSDTLQDHPPTVEEVWNEFKKYFLRILIYQIPIYLIVVAGMIFFLFPGLYLVIAFVPFTIIVVVEDQTFGGAWNRCFNLIKDNFWASVGVYFVSYIIYAISAGIISSIIGLLTGLSSYFTTRDISGASGLITSVFSVFSSVFYIVFYVSVCLHYFNLVEKHDGTGIMRRLDNFGSPANDSNNSEEHY